MSLKEDKITQIYQYQGMIPPPEMMERLNAMNNSFPERIMLMAEDISKINNQIALQDAQTRSEFVINQKNVIITEYKFKMFGLIATFVITLLMISLAFLFIKNGNSAEGITSLIIAFGTILPSIIKGITAK
jgi:uncharacterized membrane protein